MKKISNKKFNTYNLGSSRYGRPNPETNAPAWPILADRYQLLSLLGKGGFSEVYKVGLVKLFLNF